MCEETMKDQNHELALAEQHLREADHIPQWLKDVLLRPARPPSLKFWSPPDDLDKPHLPYLPGFSTKTYRHHPEREISRRFIDSKDYLENITQSGAVVANPPIENPVFSENETAQLTITGLIAVGEARGAQIASCTITLLDENGEAATAFQAVAKIYDPLYYSFKSEIANYPKDCAYDAYQEYKAEATAYEHLGKWEKSLEGPATSAKYYGSWIFWLPITINGKPQTRSIRLVLIEQLNGVSLEDMRVQNNHDKSMGTDAFHYPEEFRLEVLARVLDGYVRQFKTGLIHGDLGGDNVVLVTNDSQVEVVCGLTMPRIVLIDYDRAIFEEVTLEQAEGLPSNPGECFWDLCLWDLFVGWVPNEWDDLEGQQKWLLERFVKSEHQHLYQPVSEYFLSRIDSGGISTTEGAASGGAAGGQSTRAQQQHGSLPSCPQNNPVPSGGGSRPPSSHRPGSRASGSSKSHSQNVSSDSEEDPSDPAISKVDPIPGISKGPYSGFDDSREFYLKYIQPNIPRNHPAGPTGEK